MSLSLDDFKAIADMITEAIEASRHAGPVPDPAPSEVPVVRTGKPADEGPLTAGLDAVGSMFRQLWDIDAYAAKVGGRFTRSDVYTLMAEIISKALRMEEDWVVGSEPSWRFTAEAFQTRASQVFGDKMTTEFPVFENKMRPELGPAQGMCSVMDIVLRRLVSQFNAQEADRDLGPTGELLTNGECVRLAYVVLDVVTDLRLVPSDDDSVFMKVRLEVFDQYKAMGEGVFGSWSHPGAPVPWSWGGQ